MFRFLRTFLLFAIVSFSMLWLGDRLSTQGMVLTRYMATGQAPLIGLFYPNSQRDAITVVMFDDEFLKDANSAWPISYSDHAGWLLRLTEDPDARPRALFLDITFGQQRDDPSLPELQEALCIIRHERGIPVFLAGLHSREDGRLHLRKDLEQTVAPDGASCFELVGVRHIPDPVDNMTWNYPLTTYANGQDWVSGTPPSPDMPAFRSAAMAMAQDVEGIDLGKETSPLALIWGATPPTTEHPSQLLRYCHGGKVEWTRAVPHVLRQVFGISEQKPICPYHPTLSMAHIASMDDASFGEYARNRYLIVGAAVEGYNDMARSPIHGLIPGPYVHAMALDNLLVFKGEYKQNSEWGIPPSSELFLSGLAAIFAVFVVHEAFAAVRQRWFRRKHRHHWYGRDTSLGWRLINALVRMVVWLARTAAQTVLAMILIVLLQMWFRIGMLPVIELVGMTILAEGLNYTEKLRTFFMGKTRRGTWE